MNLDEAFKKLQDVETDLDTSRTYLREKLEQHCFDHFSKVVKGMEELYIRAKEAGWVDESFPMSQARKILSKAKKVKI